MNNYDDVNAMFNDSSLRVTMEHYIYNFWALLALICVIILLKMMDQMYLYNSLVIFIVVIFFVIYLTYN